MRCSDDAPVLLMLLSLKMDANVNDNVALQVLLLMTPGIGTIKADTADAKSPKSMLLSSRAAAVAAAQARDKTAAAAALPKSMVAFRVSPMSPPPRTIAAAAAQVKVKSAAAAQKMQVAWCCCRCLRIQRRSKPTRMYPGFLLSLLRPPILIHRKRTPSPSLARNSVARFAAASAASGSPMNSLWLTGAHARSRHSFARAHASAGLKRQTRLKNAQDGSGLLI